MRKHPERRGWRLSWWPVVIALAGCASPACGPGRQAVVDDTLYFGLLRPDGRVSAEEWSAFLRDVVTPRFPAGLSAWPVAGQWRSDDGRVTREDAMALTIVHVDDAQSDASLREIADLYKQRFAQEAVLRVTTRACMSL